MIMRTQQYLLAATLTLAPGLAGCQERPSMNYSIKVVDENGTPVPNCEVGSSVFERHKPGEGFGRDIYDSQKLLTDSNGVAQFNRKSTRQDVKFMVYPPNDFYRDMGDEFDFKPAKGGVWQPDNKSFEVVIKRIKNPIAMHAKVGPGFVPEKDKNVGYDMEVGDWVPPYGKGKVSDLILHYHLDVVGESESTSVLKVSFSNDGDGIIPFEAPLSSGSSLRSSHLAPERGYKPLLVHRREIRPGKADINTRKRTMNYYIRVRTVKDENGKIVSAHYGKIYGDFMSFTHYLNPTANDRNVEFDRKKNLIKLGRGEHVQYP